MMRGNKTAAHHILPHRGAEPTERHGTEETGRVERNIIEIKCRENIKI